MSTTNTKKATTVIRLLPIATAAATLLLAAAAQAAAPGITSAGGAAGTFNLDAQAAYINQPDGNQVYSWGYGCAASTTAPTFSPAAISGATCSTMQIPGPTLIVTEGTTVTINLTNSLPTSAGNTSIVFPGFNVCVGTLTGASATSAGTCTASATNGVAGLLAQEAAPGGTVTYSFYAATPGTRSYYSGTQGDLQVEMGMYGAIIVLPKPSSVPLTCTTGLPQSNLNAEAAHGEADFRLSQSAYDHPDTCYDREYLFQFSEMDLNIHRAAQAQVAAKGACTVGALGCSLEVPTEPYHPGYFLINGRSMPDDMDPNYDTPYPHQPYNGNPHMHPGEVVLLRVIGQGRWEHPFHEHANHVRILARDGNPIIANAQLPYTGSSPGVSTASPITAQALAGMLMFTTDTFPGQSFDGLFYFTGKGLNWDLYGHNPTSTDPLAGLACTPDANGYNTAPATGVGAMNYYEWCQDHNKPLEANPFGDVNGGGPMTLPNPNIFTNGAWYGGTPYLGPDATVRASSTLPAANGQNGQSSGCIANGVSATTVNCTNLQPSNTQANPPNERGIAFMWHSHNEREITTDNVFPGGMLMMMLVDSREFLIDESK